MLSQEEKNVIKKVIDEMTKCDLFSGRYDAKHGNVNFMLGICSVMEYFAYAVSNEYGYEFSNMFAKNIVESQKNS